MGEFLTKLFSSDFMPHGSCYLWQPQIVWLHAISDGVITFSYYLIPIALIYFVRKRRDLPFNWMFVLFGIFIFGCGTTHLMEVWTLWHGTYRLSGVIKAITAVASLATAALLIPLIPHALALPSPAEIREANERLEREISVRRRAQQALQQAHAELEIRVQQRTAELANANDGLRTEIGERKRAEDALQKARTLFENFFEFSPDARIVTDANGRIIKVNSEVGRVFGYAPTELEGLPVEILMPERFRGRHPDHRRRYIARPSVRMIGMGLELYGRRKDGAEFPVDIMLSPVGTADGPIFLSAIRDISEQKRAEEALRQSERQLLEKEEQARRELQEIINAIPQQVFVCGADWSPLFANQRELEYTGLTPQEAQSKDAVARIFHPDDFKKLKVLRDRMSSERVPSEMEARIRGKCGQYRWFLIRDNPLRDEQGRVLRWYGTRTDIEDRKLAEEALRKAQADLDRAVRIMTIGELATSIAHEVNQPISGIVINAKTCLRWLAGDPPNLDEAREAVHRIVRDGKRAGDVIARVRALAMKTPAEKERLDMNEAFREVVILAADEMRRNSVTLRTEFANDLAPVLGDRIELQQVVLNLVMNGLQAMKTIGEGRRELKIKTQNDEANQVRVTVQDTGIGLDPQNMERIFDAFYTTKQGGMGMGLSISRSIVLAHGGRLWAVPNDGPGTSFHFVIPKYRSPFDRA